MRAPLKGGILEAGRHAELAVTVFDQFGNVTVDLGGHPIEATAHGPATVPFTESAAGVYRSVHASGMALLSFAHLPAPYLISQQPLCIGFGSLNICSPPTALPRPGL